MLVRGRFQGRNDSAAGFVQMAAVVKLAFAGMRLQIWHVVRQLRCLDVVQAEFLETR